MAFAPGSSIVRRYRKRDVITWAQAVTVVSDDEHGLLLWAPVGAPLALYRNDAELGIRELPIDELVGATLRMGTWQHAHALMLHPPGTDHSVWWFFEGERFAGWYVNLEAPYTRHAIGIDTTDYALDLVVDPDLRVSWKDEDEFAARTGRPGYWDEARAATIRAAGTRLARAAEAGAYPFDGTYRDFRPEPSWSLPEMPDGWEQPVRRKPPLPKNVPVTADRLASRAVGDRPSRVSAPITISAWDPAWPVAYAVEEAKIRDALGAAALAVEHVGSTAVPGLAAKERLDIDLIVADPDDEDAYVPALSKAGYTLRTREPDWYRHRCLWTDDHGVNLHVFGPDCDEHLRHLILRDRLRAYPSDRALYTDAKRRAAADHPMDMAGYVQAKSEVIVAILRRAGLV